MNGFAGGERVLKESAKKVCMHVELGGVWLVQRKCDIGVQGSVT